MFTAIDMRQTPDGELVVFEANSSPDFTADEAQAGHPLSDCLARLLAGGLSLRSAPEKITGRVSVKDPFFKGAQRGIQGNGFVAIDPVAQAVDADDHRQLQFARHNHGYG
ncbi:MAG: hypothetical protein R2857_07915 [Vampirovibrionales bacterium]